MPDLKPLHNASIFFDDAGIVVDFSETPLCWVRLDPVAARFWARSLMEKADEFEASRRLQ